MSTLVVVVIVGAIIAISVGLATALIDTLSLIDRRRGNSPNGEPLTIDTGTVYWSYTLWTIALGVLLMASPPDWFGPSWSYFSQLPHNGFGMGLCLTLLSLIQAAALWQHARERTLAVMFLLNGFVYWMAGSILGAEGLLGHKGLWEAPFMMWIGAQAFAHAIALMGRARGGSGRR